MTGTGTAVDPAGGWPAPAPGAAPLPTMIVAQAGLELRTLLRNGEQLLLTLVIPVLLLSAFSRIHIVKKTGIDFLVPGILALAVMSTAFTSQAIATGFERRYGVLKRLGSTPLPRGGLIGAKAATVLVVELAQAAVIFGVGAALGWHPNVGPAGAPWVVVLLLAGTAAFSGLALLLAGTLRAEATLALANLMYLVLLGVGGMLFPLREFPRAIRPLLQDLPPGALSDGLRQVLQAGAVSLHDLVHDVVVLTGWGVILVALAARTFRWE